MLPKIISGFTGEPETFFESEGLNENQVLFFDGEGAQIKELREWIAFALRVLGESGTYSIVIWNAGKLSNECQSILLKPLEEKKSKTKIFLLVKTETDLLPTIISRCELVVNKPLENESRFWGELLSLWKEGPGSILEYSEKMKTDDLGVFFTEVIYKIKNELKKSVNLKRLEILSLTLESYRAVEFSNVNKRLILENFLLKSWRSIKT